MENGGLRVFSCNSLTTTTIQKQCKETQRHKTNPTQLHKQQIQTQPNPTQHNPIQHKSHTTQPNTNPTQNNPTQCNTNPNYPTQYNTNPTQPKYNTNPRIPNPTQPNTNLTQEAKRERSRVIDVKRKFYGNNNHYTVHTNTITRRKKLPIEPTNKTTLSHSLKNNQIGYNRAT